MNFFTIKNQTNLQRLSLLLLHNKHHKFYIEDDQINLEIIQCPMESYKMYAGNKKKKSH